MKVLVQRVTRASVTIEGKVYGSIDKGFLLLVGFGKQDNEETINKVIKKVLDLRIFEDQAEKMNLNLEAVDGKILSISQFTLYANVSEGKRPSFSNALNYQQASQYYDYFNSELRKKGAIVETGIFGADMKVELLNDGPVTIMIDSEDL